MIIPKNCPHEKIPQGKSKAGIRRRKIDRKQTTIHKTFHRKLKIAQREHYKNRG